MKIIRTMSIIGIVCFSVSFLFIILLIDSDPEAAVGWGLIALLYGIPYSIVCLVQSRPQKLSDHEN
jgi:hypothetical protein